VADGVCGFTTAILITHFIPYAIDRGIAPSTAATALGVMNGLNEEEARVDIMSGLVFFGVGLGLIFCGGFVAGRWLM
jgi:hypothetical protein